MKPKTPLPLCTSPPLTPQSPPPSTPRPSCSLASADLEEPLQELATTESTTWASPSLAEPQRPCSHEFLLWCKECSFCYAPDAQLSEWTRHTVGSRPRKLPVNLGNGFLSSSAACVMGFKKCPNLKFFVEFDYLPLYVASFISSHSLACLISSNLGFVKRHIPDIGF